MRVLALVACAILMAGCVTGSATPTYVVRFTLVNTSGDTLAVDEYPHCGTASLHDDHVLVDSPRPSGKAIVYIEPRFDGPGWAYLGDEPMARGLDPDAVVPDGVPESTAAVVHLSLQDGVFLIDGVARDLPFNGTKVQPGLWNATFTVEEGPARVRVDHRSKSCA